MYLLQFLDEEVILDLFICAHFGNSTLSHQTYLVKVLQILNGMSDKDARFGSEFTQEKVVEDLFHDVFI